MNYRMQAPVVDELMRELGFDPSQGLSGMVTRVAADAGTGADAAGEEDDAAAGAPPESPDERFKITVYILGTELRSDGIRAAVFRQEKTGEANWLRSPHASRLPK